VEEEQRGGVLGRSGGTGQQLQRARVARRPRAELAAGRRPRAELVAERRPRAELAAGQQLRPRSSGAAASGEVRSGAAAWRRGGAHGGLAAWWSSGRWLLAEEARGGTVEGSAESVL
jgi:hypothetical protein